MNPTKRLPGLDFLRALAVISVVTYHYPKVPDQIVLRAMTHYGWAGVDLFFVLSGFLIGGQFFLIQTQGQAMDLVPFYLRRFFRTLPNYVVVLAISYFCARTQGTLFPNFWKYLLFIQNFGLPTIFSNSWSICVEEQFYVFFPIIGILTARRLKDKSFTLLLSLF